MRSSLTAACTLVDAHASIKYARMIAMAEVSDSVTASESQPLVAPERGSPSLQRGTGSNGEVRAFNQLFAKLYGATMLHAAS